MTRRGNGETKYSFMDSIVGTTIAKPDFGEVAKPETTKVVPFVKEDGIIQVWGSSTKERAMSTREEELHDKYLDQRFKNIDDKLDGIKGTIESSKKDNQNILNMIQSEIHDQNQRMNLIIGMFVALTVGIIAALLGIFLK